MLHQTVNILRLYDQYFYLSIYFFWWEQILKQFFFIFFYCFINKKHKMSPATKEKRNKKIQEIYIKNSKARNNCFSKRKKTIIKNLKLMETLTGCKTMLFILKSGNYYSMVPDDAEFKSIVITELDKSLSSSSAMDEENEDKIVE